MRGFTISRVVAFLTPVFAGLAGYTVTLATKLPGAPQLDEGQLTALFIAGATAGTAAAVKWLDGRSKHERQESAAAAEKAYQDAYVNERGMLPEVTAIPPALEADLSRAVHGLRSMDERLETLERAQTITGTPGTLDGPDRRV